MNIRPYLKTVLIALLLLPSLSAYSAGESGNRIVRYVEVTTDGDLIIEGDANFNNPDYCTNPNRVVVLASNVNRNLYYAAILTAYSTGNYFWAWLEGCWNAPWGEQYPIVINGATRSAQ